MIESQHAQDLTRARPRAVSAAELYAVLEDLLPFARLEVECLADFVGSEPDNPAHEEDRIRVGRGLAALDTAERLIARKSNAIRRKKPNSREAPATSSPV